MSTELEHKLAFYLRRIARGYRTPKHLRRTCERDFGLEYVEALEMAYENIQEDAAKALKGVRLTPVKKVARP